MGGRVVVAATLLSAARAAAATSAAAPSTTLQATSGALPSGDGMAWMANTNGMGDSFKY